MREIRKKEKKYETTQSGDPSITHKDLEKEQGNNRLSRTSAYFSDHHMNSLHTFELHNNLDDLLQPQRSEKLQHQKGTAKEEDPISVEVKKCKFPGVRCINCKKTVSVI